MAVWGGMQAPQAGGKRETLALLSRKRALGLGMKMLDPALPAECWVSIIQRCSITALYLSAVITSSDMLTDREPVFPRPPGGGGWWDAWHLKFCVFAFDYCGYSSDSLNASHLANLQQGQAERERERDGVVCSGADRR